MTRHDRVEGVLLGLACGDALGRPVEFRSPDSIATEFGELTEMIGGGTHGKPAGTVTDDTDMALCIAESVVEEGKFDPDDVAERFVAWYESKPFDIGLMTADALARIAAGTPWETAGTEVWEARAEGSNAGNGSVMRCAPLALAFAGDALQTVSQESSAITHADPRCTHGCAALNLTIAALLRDADRPLATALDALDSAAPESLRERLESVRERDPADLANTGYVLDTLETGLHHGLTADSAERAVVAAVNEGGDADSIGAVAGAVAGARFGASALPDRWCGALTTSNLRGLARDLDALNPLD